LATIDGRPVWNEPIGRAPEWVQSLWADTQRLLASPIPPPPLDGADPLDRARLLEAERRFVQARIDAMAPFRERPPPPRSLDARERFFLAVVTACTWDRMAAQVDALPEPSGMDAATAEAFRGRLRDSACVLARQARGLYFVCKMITPPHGLERWRDVCGARMRDLDPYCVRAEPP
jgi:hypothetical protein